MTHKQVIETFLKKYKELVRDIEYHRHLYYQLAESEIDDFQFDMKFKQLQDIEEEYPDLNCACSPLSMTENSDEVFTIDHLGRIK